MFPYKTSLLLDRKSSTPLYLQLSNQFISLIKECKLPSGSKLIGSRALSDLLGVHRKTVVACYEELMLQGWVESIPKKGTFVHSDLPVLHQKDFVTDFPEKETEQNSFSFYANDILGSHYKDQEDDFIYINDGLSDVRLTPVEELARIYRKVASKKTTIKHLSYGTPYGNDTLRNVLVSYLNETRGLTITKDNILITRGSQMGIYLASQLLLKNDDKIIVGNTSYQSATRTFKQHNANVLTVSVDKCGLNITEVEALCKKHTIKALYVTSHHHHPTTVTLSAERRLHLLNLARAYNFAIIEDDYDYDFNYNHAPILPLASHDTNGNVIYIGSVCKTVAPVFRVGYLIAPKPFVDEASRLRKYIDRQGDAVLELAFAEFIKSGDLDRHIRKILKIYKLRRDLMCKLLKDELSEFFSFEIPKGGMAIWLQLNKKYTWEQVSTIAKKHKLIISNQKNYDLFNINHNALRLGFAHYNEEEIYELIAKLAKTYKVLKSL